MNDNISSLSSYEKLARGVLKQLIVDSNKEEFKEDIKKQLHDSEYTEYWKELCIHGEVADVEFFRHLITNVGAE